MAVVKHKIDLGPVQETLLIPLWARARETERENPLIEDPMALRLMQEIEYDFGRLDRLYGAHQSIWPGRDRLLDQVVQDYLLRHPDGQVVNLGCGLDTSFYRLDNGRVRWLEVDLPDTMALRASALDELEDDGRHRLYVGSGFESGWMAQLRALDPPPLVISAGMLIYFSHQEVRRLTHGLASRWPGMELAFDTVKPVLPRYRALGIRWFYHGRRTLRDLAPRVEILSERFYLREYTRRWPPPLRLLALPPLYRWTAGVFHLRLSK